MFFQIKDLLTNLKKILLVSEFGKTVIFTVIFVSGKCFII
jgi:hypothetical protein